MSGNLEFLWQTAQDYDIDFETVKLVNDHNDERLYENLEIILKKRRDIEEDFTTIKNPVVFYGL